MERLRDSALSVLMNMTVHSTKKGKENILLACLADLLSALIITNSKQGSQAPVSSEKYHHEKGNI